MSALVQVNSGLSGTGQQIGGVSAATTAQVQATIAQVEANKAAAAAAAAANGVGGGVGPGIGNGNGAGPGQFDVSSAIPNNFWGYVMLIVGMR